MGYLGGKRAVGTFLTFMFSLCVFGMYMCDMQYGAVGVQDVITSNFLSKDQLALVRIVCGFVVWSTCIHMLVDPTGLTIQVMTPYGEPKALHVVGISRFTAFTQWSWALQGWYFGFCTILWFLDKYYPMVLIDKSYGVTPYVTPLSYAVWIIYELSVTMSFIVSSLVTFALIPQAKGKGLPIDNYFRPLTLMMHNLNVLFMTIELGINSFQFVMAHIFVPAMWGFTYIFFAWWWYNHTGVFFYFFVDYHHKKSVIMHAGLLTLMSCYFALCAAVATYIQHKSTGENEFWPWLALLAFSVFCMKWPAGKEWSIVTNAMVDTWNRVPYKQAPPNKKALAAAKAGATLKKPPRATKKKTNKPEAEAEAEVEAEAAEPARNSVRSRSRSGDNKASNGKSKSRSCSCIVGDSGHREPHCHAPLTSRGYVFITVIAPDDSHNCPCTFSR